VNRKQELILIALFLLCLPITVIDWKDVFFFSDTDWLFIWATYSRLWGRFVPILYPTPPSLQFPDLTSAFLSLLWIGAALVACFILYGRRDDTFMRNISLLLILLFAQLITPIVLFTLLVQGLPIHSIWILPIPSPSLLAIAIIVNHRIKSNSASNLNLI
jgi:hypothetical protein